MMRVILACALSLLGAGSGMAAVTPTAVSVNVTERPALEVVELIAAQCQSGLSADPSVLARLNMPVTFTCNRLTWDQTRQAIANALRLELSLAGELLHVTNTGEALDTGRLAMRYYNVASLTKPAPDHRAMPLDLAHDLNNATANADALPMQANRNSDIHDVIQNIQRQVEPPTWEWEDVAIEQWDGHVVVTNTPAVQIQVVAHLAHQEALAQRQCVCRVYRLATAPPGTNTVLTAQEWATLAPKVPPAAVFIARNGQRQRHLAGQQRALIVDADQNQAQQVPITQVISTGLSLSLRPTILVDAVRIETRLWLRPLAKQIHDGHRI